jgi:LysM repeat protein
MRMSSGPLLSVIPALAWMVALAGVLAFHCKHVMQMRGQRRCYHCAHIVMLLGMLQMYASTAFGWNWLSPDAWMVLYAVTSAAIIIWILVRLGQQRSFSTVWTLALVQQGAMVYMWAPMAYWVPRISYGFAAYFALEAIAWLTGLCHDEPDRCSHPLAEAARSRVLPLVKRPTLNNICMTLMAASMGYMFAGMQLTMSEPSQQLVQYQQPVPAQAVGNASRYKPKSSPATQTPKPLPNERATQSAKISSPAPADRYTIVAGDSLWRIAARLYGDGRQWHSIAQANPRLDPRRLHVGQTINLPTPVERP